MLSLFTVVKAYSQTPLLVPDTEGITKFEKVNNEIFFFRTVDSSGTWVQQIWKTGTSISSATMVKSLGVLMSPIGPIGLTKVINGKLFFTDGQQVWVSDGTDNGTFPLFTSSYQVYSLFEFADELYFSNYSLNLSEQGMYKSDGTIAGTGLLYNFQTRGTGNEGVYNYVNFNNKIIFSVNKGIPNNPTTHYLEIWSTDGTSTGFVRLDSLKGDIRRYMGGNEYPTPSDWFREYNGYLYFVFINKVTASDELWRTDGTVGGANYFYDAFHPVIEYNGKLILAGGYSGTGTELYSTDGTTTGTVMIKDINTSGPGFLPSKPFSFHITCNKLFFLAVDSGMNYNDSRIWVTDGTANGTLLYTQPRGYYGNYRQSNGILYYSVQDNNNDSVKVFMIDTNTCSPVKVLSWPYADYGYISGIVQLNPLFVSLSGGAAGSQGLYGFDMTSSISETSIGNPFNLKFYPNPASNFVTITSIPNGSTLRITDLTGKLVYSSVINSTQEIVSTADFVNGIYFVQVENNGSVTNKKFVVNK